MPGLRALSSRPSHAPPGIPRTLSAPAPASPSPQAPLYLLKTLPGPPRPPLLPVPAPQFSRWAFLAPPWIRAAPSVPPCPCPSSPPRGLYLVFTRLPLRFRSSQRPPAARPPHLPRAGQPLPDPLSRPLGSQSLFSSPCLATPPLTVPEAPAGHPHHEARTRVRGLVLFRFANPLPLLSPLFMDLSCLPIPFLLTAPPAPALSFEPSLPRNPWRGSRCWDPSSTSLPNPPPGCLGLHPEPPDDSQGCRGGQVGTVGGWKNNLRAGGGRTRGGAERLDSRLPQG